MKRLIITHVAVLLVGIALGFAVTKYWVVSPKKVTIEMCNMLSAFGISETNAPLEQLVSLVWQAVENPRRRKWTVKSYSWTETAGPYYFPETNESIGPFYAIGETNEMTQHQPAP